MLEPTSVARPDVPRVFSGAGPATGFEQSIEVGGGTKTLYLYAIDASGGSNPLIGTKAVTVESGDPRGAVDSVTSPAAGLVRVKGWAFDPSDGRTRIRIHVYVGGPAGSGAPGYDVGRTWVSRPDVDHAVPGAGGRTGFDLTLPSPAGQVPVWVYGIDVGPGENAAVGGRTAPVAAGRTSLPPAAAALAPLPTSTGKRSVQLRWDSVAKRPSAITFDVRMRVRTGTDWGTWRTIDGLGATDARSADVAVKAPP